MTVKECYLRFDGDYEDTLRRLASEDIMRRFILRFPEDDCYEKLCTSYRAGNDRDAFMAAHAMKGLCLTLGMTALGRAASDMTEALRHGRADDADELLARLEKAYGKTVDAIAAMKSEGEG